VTFAHHFTAKAEEGLLGAGRKLRRAGPSGGATASQAAQNTRNPMVGSTLQIRAGSERRKPSGRWKTVKAEQGGTVAPFHSKHRQQCGCGSGLFGSVQRRGDLWKSQERHSTRARKVLVEGEDGGVGKGDAKCRRVLNILSQERKSAR
jgi:hypothetical protein